ncbi:hypothetical protein EWM64_g5576 [Hericium alpestre]|uniref:Alpha/beta hydrolase fold-3 domain-containing protein n=1 Tax=Hericium alpestre TaxID=135208 RepID=A0A4Y9ZV28_9AGAM|nr:hypothetical protein EWM64_g5576 [Hericium alpestre]
MDPDPTFRDNKTNNTYYLGTSIAMFALCASLLILNFVQILLTPDFVAGSQCVGSLCVSCNPGEVDRVNQAVIQNFFNVLLDFVFATNQLVADSLLIFRCYILWKGRTWIVIAPAIILLANTGLTFAQAYCDITLYYLRRTIPADVKVRVPGEEKGKGSGSSPNGETLRGESGSGPETQKGGPDSGSGAGDGLNGIGSGGKERRLAAVEDNDPDVWEDIEDWMPKPPKVLMEDPNETPLELRGQIQQYATNEQLMHPLVSPVLQGTLCNLPPLYIITGDDEVLRDEIIYLAHRAAHPDEFPARKDVIRERRRQKENIDKFRTPTKVFDEMPHVLTVFSFTDSAKYAYRSIAQFVRHVTMHSPEHLSRNPFPELHRPECEIHLDEEACEDEDAHVHHHRMHRLRPHRSRKHVLNAEDADEVGVRRYKENEDAVGREVVQDQADRMPGTEVENKEEVLPASCAADGEAPTAQRDIPHILMIRERVDIHGRARPMEPKDQVGALRLRPPEVGVIKEAPVKRWLAGQARMDAKYPRRAARLERRRKKLVKRAEMMIRDARDQGFLMQGEKDGVQGRPKKLVRLDSAGSSMSMGTSKGAVIDVERRWGPLDLEAERPPPSAIAGRRDTPEALALLKKSIYYTAPVTHKTVPRTKRMQDLRAIFDPNDNPIRAPRQSVAEEQTHTHLVPLHGLSIWDSLVV